MSRALDGVYLEGGIVLPVTALLAIAFPPLVFENNDFFCPTLSYDAAAHRGPGHRWLSHAHGVTVGEHKNLIKGDRAADITLDLFNPNGLSLRYFVLFSTRRYYSIHDNNLFETSAPKSLGLLVRTGLGPQQKNFSIFIHPVLSTCFLYIS